MEIRFNVSHQKLTKETTNDYFVAGSKNYLIAKHLILKLLNG